MSKKAAQGYRTSGGWFCILALAGFVAVFLGGCAAVVKVLERPERTCPASKNIDELLEALARRWEKVKPFRANGQCLLQYYDAEDRQRRENFQVKLWVEPPDKMCLYGDVAFNAKGIMFGCNEQEFWLAIRPKEIRGYWWGRQNDNRADSAGWQCFTGLPFGLSPSNLLDGLALVRPGEDGANENWVLSNEGRFDVLTRYEAEGRLLKKIYVDCCNFLFYRIEYFDEQGRPEVVMKLGGYRRLSESFFVPAKVEISYCRDDEREDLVTIALRSIKLVNFSEKQEDKLFTRPPSKHFGPVYHLDENCRFVRE